MGAESIPKASINLIDFFIISPGCSSESVGARFESSPSFESIIASEEIGDKY